MILGGLAVAAAGLAGIAWGGSPWERTRAGWRGMISDEAMRWDGHRTSPAKAAALRWGALLTLCGVGLLVAGAV